MIPAAFEQIICFAATNIISRVQPALLLESLRPLLAVVARNADMEPDRSDRVVVLEEVPDVGAKC